MNVISRRALTKAQRLHPRCRAWLDAWWRTAKREQWANLHDVRQTYVSADQVGKYLVFNAPEAKRLIVGIRYACHKPLRGGTLFVKHFLSHAEYERGAWKE